MKKKKMYSTATIGNKKNGNRYGTVTVMDSMSATKAAMPYIHVPVSGCGAHKTDRMPSRARRKTMDRREYGI